MTVVCVWSDIIGPSGPTVLALCHVQPIQSTSVVRGVRFKRIILHRINRSGGLAVGRALARGESLLSCGSVFIASETGFPPSDTGGESLWARRRGIGHGGSSGVLGSENLF